MVQGRVIHIQEYLLDLLGPSGPGRQAILAEVRPALIELRDAYRSRVEPRYSDLSVRRAYGLAYMPMYVAALEALYFRSSVWDHLARKRSITIGSLGTGPGTEVLAFALAMRRAGVHSRITSVIAIDRCREWENLRWQVLGRLNEHLGNPRIGTTMELVNDLSTSTGRIQSLDALRHCQVVLASGVLSELDPSTRALFFTGMRHYIEPGAWLFVSDFPGSNGYTPSHTAWSFDGLSIRDVMAQASERVERQHPDLEEHLYAARDGLRPQRTLKPHLASFLLTS